MADAPEGNAAGARDRLSELEAAYLAAREAKNIEYWKFTRMTNYSPVKMIELAAIEAEARRAWLEAKRKIT